MDNSSVETYRQYSSTSRDQLIEDNVDYVARILSTMSVVYTNTDLRETLNSAGLIGLIEAANAFDPSEGVAFRTFAYPRIRGAIIDELRKQSPISKRVFSNLRLIKQACELLQSPTLPEDIADSTGLSLDAVMEGLEAMRFINPAEWDEFKPIDANWHDSESPDDVLEREERKQVLAEAIASLADKERLAITLYYLEEMNLAEIGATLDLSVSRVSRILSSAKFRLKEVMSCKFT
ncbi:MAG: sigma-70 family RNA polymerase sigma factor [Planctomycetota bacterium]|nr:sigma-70 family RNA polymerase sigma factor [Planctomycetota bacterium]